MFRRSLIATTGLLAAPRAFAQRSQESFEITSSETATIDGRYWDKPIPGGTTMDAVHRSVLLRFPTAADEFADLLRAGRALAQAELVMRFAGTEIVPDGYLCRDGLGRKVWTESPPNWHVRAWPLRHPWRADKERGPTFNASVNGKRYWKRYGARDAADRGAELGDPQELSQYTPEARFDITKLLATPMIEREAGARLRWLEQSGFLLAKLETYDTRYRAPDAYEWAMPIGGHGLSFAEPKLVLAMRRTGGTVAVTLPLALRAEWEMGQADGSRPTAVVLTAAEVAERGQRAMQVKGSRPEWEAARLRELLAAAGDRVSAWGRTRSEDDYKAYLGHLRELLSTPPRYWQGWSIQDDLLHWYVFRDLLPPPAQDHMRAYWTAWLQNDLPTDAFVHPQSPDAIDYWRRNRDWRGRASFFRDGYNYAVSTQNFNHTAAMGSLLGGDVAGADRAIADGRHGLEKLVLRFWAFQDGSTQEMLDHYYVSITLSAQKMIADYAPTALDRLMGRIVLDRTMELLISAYNPRLRRFAASSGRARLAGVMIEQDGIYGALHTLSREGTLLHIDAGPKDRVHGLPVWGYDFPPGRVAIQTLHQPWMPAWVSNLIDDKPVPSEDTATETTRGNFRQQPLWRRSYLGRWHSLASADIRGGTVDVLAQWVREPRKAQRMEDIGTLTLRYAANEPNLANTHEGHSEEAGLPITFQSRNRAIVFAKPHPNRDRFLQAFPKGANDSVWQLAAVIGLWNFAEKKDWEIYVGGQRITTFPHRSKASDRILIRDGISYLAILPIAPTDLGRDAEIEIGPGGAGKAPPTGAVIAPALTISIINLRRPQPVPLASLDARQIAGRTYAAFALELGDVDQHGSFEGFTRHIAANTLTTNWRAEQTLLEVTYKSGNDLMEAAFSASFGQPLAGHFAVDPGQQDKAIPLRRLNGQWPYLPPGLDRDTSWAQQGSTGRLEKNGAVLTSEAGRKAYLMCDPTSGSVLAYNPLPDPQAWSLAARDGASFKADGKVGLMRLEYRPSSREVFIDHHATGDTAKRLLLSGFKEAPRVTVNGKRIDATGSAPDFQVALS